MHITESKITPGMWFIKDFDIIIKVMYSKAKAMVEMKKLQKIEDKKYFERKANENTRTISKRA